MQSRIRPDIIHAHSPALNAIPALAVGRRLGIPVVYEVRAFWEDAAVDHGTTTEGGLRYRATRGLETYALRGVDHVTTICEGLRRDIIGRGIAAERVTVIPNAVDAETFRFGEPADDALRERLGLRGAAVLGFVGSFYSYEGIDAARRGGGAIAARPSALESLAGRRRARRSANPGECQQAWAERLRRVLRPGPELRQCSTTTD